MTFDVLITVCEHPSEASAHPLDCAIPSNKSIKIKISGMLASVITRLVSREHQNSESTSSRLTPPATASSHQPASMPLAPASPLLQELSLAWHPAGLQSPVAVRKNARRRTQHLTNGPLQGQQYHCHHQLRLVFQKGSLHHYSSDMLCFPNHL